VARAQAQLDQSDAALRALEVDISTSIRARAALLAAARERAAQYRDVLIPLREEIVALMQRQVNYMLDDPSRLLLARQKAFAAYQGYLEAVRDYQLARVELVRAVGAPLPASAGAVAAPLDARGLIAPSPGAGHGMNHTDMNHGGAEHHGVDHGGMDHGSMNHVAPGREGTGHEGMHHEGAEEPAMQQHDTHSGEPR
jgi:cobalt-zinc-cadmium efflux system outer membrane protein